MDFIKGKVNIKKIFINLLVVILVLLVSYLVEIYIFNSGIKNINKNNQIDKIDILSDKYILNDSCNINNKKLQLLSEKNIIKFSNNEYVKYLEFKNSNNNNITITITKNNKTLSKVKLDNIVETRIIQVDSILSDVEINIIDENSKYPVNIELSDITINNKLYFNSIRFIYMIAIILLIYWFILNYKNIDKKLHLLFLFIAIISGTTFVFTMPLHFSWDEKEHFIKSYNVSFDNLDMTDRSKVKWITEEDFFVHYASYGTTYINYPEYLNFLNKYNTNEYKLEEFKTTTALGYTPAPYIISGLGIKLSRILGLPFIYTFYIGRLFNILFYAIIISICIKYLKVYKLIAFLIALLPYAIYVSSSYTADSLLNVSSFICITLFINFLNKDKEKIKKWEILLYTFCSLLCILSKVTYLPIILLLLFIPNKKFYNSNKKNTIYLKILLFTICLIVSAITYKYSQNADLNQWNVPGADSIEQIKYILSNPIKYLMQIGYDLYTNGFGKLCQSTYSLAYSGEINKIWLIFDFIFITYMLVKNKDVVNIQIKKWQKVSLILYIIGTILLVYSALYIGFTRVGGFTIQGVQGRYFYTLFIPFILLISSYIENKLANIQNKDSIDNINKNGKSIYLVAFILTLIPLIEGNIMIIFNYLK